MAIKKPLWWTIGIFLGITIFQVGIIVITRVIISPPASWWWFFGFLIGFSFLGLVGGMLFLISRLKKVQPVKTRLDPKTAEGKAISEIKYDEHNPDNLVVEKRKIIRVGDPNHERTSILHLMGHGTELGTSIDVIINLDNPKLEMSRIDGATDTERRETIERMAERPEVKETAKTTSFDPFGRPTMTQETTKITKAQKEAEEAEKEADLKNVY